MLTKPLRVLLVLCLIGIIGVLLGADALLSSYVYLEPSLPTVDAMRSGSLAVPLRVYTRDGQLIDEIGEKRRLPVGYSDIPVLVRQAFVAAEDERFFEHHGFDYSGVLRAAWVDLHSGDFSQGASTITMQAARNMFLTFDKTIRRKLQEIFLTYRMEHEFTKQEILGTYLNVIFLGQRSYGVAAAAQTYFGKPLDQLTIAEAATLAGIPQAPSRYNPIYNPRAVHARRHYVLGQMLKLGDIDAAQSAVADATPVQARDHGSLSQVEAPFVAEMARAALVARYGEDAVNQGYQVYTTIDSRLQTAANRAVRLGLIEYERRRHGYRGALAHVALPAGASSNRLETILAKVPQIGNLHPALVTAVAEHQARVYVQSQGFAQIDWDGLSWARPRLSDTSMGPAPKRALDVVQPGDVVYVVTDRNGMAQLAELPDAQAALVALDPDDGAVAAVVGGFDYYTNKFNRATQARRQPGSGFKPFLYSCALDHGFTPATIVLDAPFVADDQERIWRPNNSEGEGDFDGPMRLREGLVYSRNLMTIRVVRQLGLNTAMGCAARFGFDPKELPQDMTLALGSLQATPMQIATAYAVFANGGFRVDSYFIDRIEDAMGNTVFQATPKVVCESCGAAAATSPGQALPATAVQSQAGAAPPAPVGSVSAAPPALSPAALAHAIPAGLTSGASAAPAATVAAAAAAPALPAGPGTTTAAVASPLALASAVPGAATGPTDPDRAPALLDAPLLPAGRIAPRVISAQNCWLMDDMMADVIRRGTGTRALVLKRSDIAGKTGTSNDYRDAWFNGFNRHIVASVWVGYDDTRPLGAGEEGSRDAVPIWTMFMREALRDQPDQARPLPPGLVTVRISRRTGLLATADDRDSMYETFMDGTVPQAPPPGAVAPGNAPTSPAGGGGQPLF
ncbi:MAG TPA: transglycosylase domain-containing protein [Steroidobacteraceae bacterium]